MINLQDGLVCIVRNFPSLNKKLVTKKEQDIFLGLLVSIDVPVNKRPSSITIVGQNNEWAKLNKVGHQSRCRSTTLMIN